MARAAPPATHLGKHQEATGPRILGGHAIGFFAELAKTDLSLRHFSNQAFFDDIVNHCFILRDMWDSQPTSIHATHARQSQGRKCKKGPLHQSQYQNSCQSQKALHEGTATNSHQ
jgi:hypothetical protein